MKKGKIQKHGEMYHRPGLEEISIVKVTILLSTIYRFNLNNQTRFTELKQPNIFHRIKTFIFFLWFVVTVFQSPSDVWLFGIPWTIARQATLSSLTPRFCSNSCHWVGDGIQSSQPHHTLLLSSTFLASGIFPMNQLFTSGGQNIRASTSVLPKNIQCWFSLGLTGLIFLLSKGFSGVFSSTTQKHQFLGAYPSLWSNIHIHTWLLEKS